MITIFNKLVQPQRITQRFQFISHSNCFLSGNCEHCFDYLLRLGTCVSCELQYFKLV